MRIVQTVPKKKILKYIARYIRHPVIADRRIKFYNGKYVLISCKYNSKTNYVKFRVDEFICRIVQHIPIKNFKLIRRYGIYSRTKIR